MEKELTANVLIKYFKHKSRMSQQNIEVEAEVENQRVEVIPSGKAVRTGINPISRYQFAAMQYNHICNMI